LRPDQLLLWIPDRLKPVRIEMNTSNSNVIGRRLDELDRQIHTCLKDIRKNLKELEQVSGQDDSAPTGNSAKTGTDKRFSTLFKAALHDQDRTPE
jgi:hypothetical protein